MTDTEQHQVETTITVGATRVVIESNDRRTLERALLATWRLWREQSEPEERADIRVGKR